MTGKHAFHDMHVPDRKTIGNTRGQRYRIANPKNIVWYRKCLSQQLKSTIKNQPHSKKTHILIWKRLYSWLRSFTPSLRSQPLAETKKRATHCRVAVLYCTRLAPRNR